MRNHFLWFEESCDIFTSLQFLISGALRWHKFFQIEFSTFSMLPPYFYDFFPRELYSNDLWSCKLLPTPHVVRNSAPLAICLPLVSLKSASEEFGEVHLFFCPRLLRLLRSRPPFVASPGCPLDQICIPSKLAATDSPNKPQMDSLLPVLYWLKPYAS